MNPIFFRYSGLAIRYSHLAFLGAFFASYYLFVKLKAQSTEEDSLETAFWFYAGGALIGGRLGYILLNWFLFEGRWLDALTLWHGAYSLWGAVFGLLLTRQLLKFYPKSLLSLQKQTEVRLSYAFPLFLSIAQWGLWFEGEGWGRQAEGLGTLAQGGLIRYPVWLYFFIGYLILTLILYRYPEKRRVFPLMLFGISLLNLVMTPLLLHFTPADTLTHLMGGSLLLIITLYWFYHLKRPFPRR